MKKVLVTLLAFLCTLVSPDLVFAQNTTWLENIADEIVYITGTALVTLMGLALVVFLWGGLVFIRGSGEEKDRIDGRSRMLWGLIALFVLASLWGIVQIMQAISGTDSPPDQKRPSVGLSIDMVYTT